MIEVQASDCVDCGENLKYLEGIIIFLIDEKPSYIVFNLVNMMYLFGHK